MFGDESSPLPIEDGHYKQFLFWVEESGDNADFKFMQRLQERRFFSFFDWEKSICESSPGKKRISLSHYGYLIIR